MLNWKTSKREKNPVIATKNGAFAHFQNADFLPYMLYMLYKHYRALARPLYSDVATA